VPADRTYDMHQHLWPPEVLRELARRTEPPWVRDGRFQGPGLPPLALPAGVDDLDQRLAWLDEAAIDVALVSLSPTDGFDERLTELWHEGILRIAAASNGRIVALASGRRRAGFAGVTVAADALTAGLGRLPAELAAAGELLFVHPGRAAPPPEGMPDWWMGAVDYCAQMQRAYVAWLARDAAAHPGLAAVFAILGGGAPLLAERFHARGARIDLRQHPNTVVDSASYGPAAVGQFIAMHGTAHLAHGSDAPVLHHCAAADCLRGLGPAVFHEAAAATPGRLLGHLR
jgi:6-methylsalicylate decarboxylase